MFLSRIDTMTLDGLLKTFRRVLSPVIRDESLTGRRISLSVKVARARHFDRKMNTSSLADDRREGEETGTEPAPAVSAAARVEPKVLVLNFDPIVKAAGRRLHEVAGWNDPRTLTATYIADVAECSGEYVRYRVVEWVDVDAYPVKKDGFRYTDDSYLRCLRGEAGWHQPDAIDYHAILRQFAIPERVDAGAIDEVWIWAFPYAGLWESTMAGAGAYFCNSPPVEGVATSRLFVIMGFNYERGVGEMLEDLGHRAESILTHVFGSCEPKESHAWNRFTLTERVAPGRAGVGSIHFAPNSRMDYDWGNPTMVWSACDDWLNYPNLTGERRRVNCREWGNGDIRAHHRWWLGHLPRAPGRTASRLNNWWAYAVDFNHYQESRW